MVIVFSVDICAQSYRERT